MSATKAPPLAQRELPAQARTIAMAPAVAPALGNQEMQALRRQLGVRPKLEVGAPDDPEEREADAAADRVMRMADGACCPACAAGDGCAGETLRRSPDSGAPLRPALTGAVEHGVRGLSQGGEPLPPTLRAFFEPRMGRSFGVVRVHRDAAAGELARAIGARAFTLGSDVAFAPGQWSPETTAGRRLIAHELAHIAQPRSERSIRRQGGAPDAGAPPAPQASSPAGPSAADQASALARIKQIDKDFWITWWQESELERLWNSFGPALPKVATENAADWERGLKGGANLWQIPTVRAIQDRFLADVAAKARGYLTENRDIAEREKQALGSDPNSAATATQAAAVSARREAAQRILNAERAMAALRTIPVGYDHVPGRAALFDSKCHPIANEKGNRDLGTKPFDPLRPPQIPPRGDEAPCGRMPSWEQANEMWTKLGALIEGETARYPSLYVLSRDFQEKDIASERGEGAADAARRLMLSKLDELLGNIRDTEPKLASGSKLLLELNPIHRQLFAAAPWKEGFESRAAHARVDEYHDAEFWKTMGLGTLAAALFIAASLATGGLAAVLLGGAVGISAGTAAASWANYLELRAASRSNLSNETALVSSGQANAALMTAVLDTVFAFLDAYSAVRGVGKLASAAARGAEATERAAPRTLEEAAAAESRLVASSIAELEAKEAPKLLEALKNGAAREVTDEALRKEGYVLEAELLIDGERHVYRQLESGRWCRFSGQICGFSFPGDIARLAEGARRGFEHPAETLALRKIVTSTTADAARVISPARIAAAQARFPLLANLSPGAIERTVHAAFAQEAGGGLRLAKNWRSAVRGQLLEEIAAARVRGLLGTQAGREALGIGHISGEVIFIEGSRIRDAGGAMLTDGVLAVQRGDRLEIVSVLESKAGSFAAGGLTEGLTGLKRASTSEILEAISASGNRGIMEHISRIDPALWREIKEVGSANLASTMARRQAMREPLMNALGQLTKEEITELRRLIQHGEGQVSRDLERLMTDAPGQPLTILVDGKPVQATVPTRPSFIGAVPSDVPTASIEHELSRGGYNYRTLDLGGTNVGTKDLDSLAKELVDDLRADLQRVPPSP